MSLRHSKAVWELRLGNSGLKLVALALADMANEAGECWPSVSHLSTRCEMSSRMVNYHLQALRKQGFVTVRPRYSNGQQRSNVFVLGVKCISSPGCNALHPESPVESPTSKESKETPSGEGALFGSVYKLDARSKQQKLASIKPPENMPSEREFDAFLQAEEMDHVSSYRPDLYSDLCGNKWHQWRDGLGKWIKIRDWRQWVRKLNELIGAQHER